MKIKMLTSMAGTDFAVARDEETDRFSDGDAQRLIEAGYAVALTAAPKAERATKKPPAETRGE